MTIENLNKICNEVAFEELSERYEVEAVSLLRELDEKHFGCPFNVNNNYYWEK